MLHWCCNFTQILATGGKTEYVTYLTVSAGWKYLYLFQTPPPGEHTMSLIKRWGNVAKDVLILHTKNEHLYHKLKLWAYRTNSILLDNPENCNLDDTANLLAVVIDSDLIDICSIPDSISERVIPSELEYDLIENILYGLKPRKTAMSVVSYRHNRKIASNG